MLHFWALGLPTMLGVAESGDFPKLPVPVMRCTGPSWATNRGSHFSSFLFRGGVVVPLHWGPGQPILHTLAE